MLDALRNQMGGWIAKIFIVLLGGSFAVWGVADIFGGYGRASIATVGEAEVSNEAFRIAFQNRIQQISRQTGQAFTLEQARAFNLHGQVLGDLIAEATLDNDAADKGLGVSRDAIARGILEDPTFRDSFGTFSRAAYEQFLAYSGLSEADYVDELRRARTRRQLASALTAGAVAPQAMQDAFHRFNSETRVVDYIILGENSIEPIAAPDEAALAAFFEDNKSEFRAPEYRRIEIIEASIETIAARIEVREEDIA
ncbi:MAG: SurA N-terminal domain-containing protein, partial [Alphaproteobacteria bacterium]